MTPLIALFIFWGVGLGGWGGGEPEKAYELHYCPLPPPSTIPPQKNKQIHHHLTSSSELFDVFLRKVLAALSTHPLAAANLDSS